MKRVLILVLGVINLIAFCLLVIVAFLTVFHRRWGTGGIDTFILIFPLSIPALIFGGFTLKDNSWRWGVTGVAYLVALILSFLWFTTYGGGG